ncbi:hypothetical protein PPROV_001023000 [Pycnococcus provasolii]|uniref:Uncharacterized protein n=1 Tax=Pycnococcus provasolii TaxID=41880 RepID=A0A830HWF3_9CHLO|nr:hypothetical protein PPROV_001023000 [Pycnococcus provasolii]
MPTGTADEDDGENGFNLTTTTTTTNPSIEPNANATNVTMPFDIVSNATTLTSTMPAGTADEDEGGTGLNESEASTSTGDVVLYVRLRLGFLTAPPQTNLLASQCSSGVQSLLNEMTNSSVTPLHHRGSLSSSGGTGSANDAMRRSAAPYIADTLLAVRSNSSNISSHEEDLSDSRAFLGSAAADGTLVTALAASGIDSVESLTFACAVGSSGAHLSDIEALVDAAPALLAVLPKRGTIIPLDPFQARDDYRPPAMPTAPPAPPVTPPMPPTMLRVSLAPTSEGDRGSRDDTYTVFGMSLAIGFVAIITFSAFVWLWRRSRRLPISPTPPTAAIVGEECSVVIAENVLPSLAPKHIPRPPEKPLPMTRNPLVGKEGRVYCHIPKPPEEAKTSTSTGLAGGGRPGARRLVGSLASLDLGLRSVQEEYTRSYYRFIQRALMLNSGGDEDEKKMETQPARGGGGGGGDGGREVVISTLPTGAPPYSPF